MNFNNWRNIMKLAIISDVGGNLVALHALFADLHKHKVDAILCLGNIIGYGPSPRQCWDLAMERRIVLTRGEMEHWIGQGIYPPNQTPQKYLFLEFTQKAVTQKQIEQMAQMTKVKKIPLNSKDSSGQALLMGHSTLLANDVGQSVNTTGRIYTEFEILEKHFKEANILLLGNNTFPIFMSSRGRYVERTCDKFNQRHHLHSDHKYLINPGAIGRPMDGHVLNSQGMMPFTYAILTIEENDVSVVYYRVQYDPTEHLNAMAEKGFPPEFIRKFTG